MTAPEATPEHGFPARARVLSDEELRAKVAELAEQVRRLADGRAPELEHRTPAGENGFGPAAPRPPQADDLAERNRGLLSTVIETAELAAAEIRAAAEREAATIRERAQSAIGDADRALARYGEALEALSAERERIERSASELRAQAVALEADRELIDAALELLKQRRAR